MAPFQFFVKLVHVLSSVFAAENGQTTFWFLRETSLSSGQCQNEHGQSANDLSGSPKQSVPIQEKMLSCLLFGFRPDSCLTCSFSKLCCVHHFGKT